MKNDIKKFKIDITQNEVPTSDKLILGGISAVTFAIMASQMLFPVNGEKPVYTTTAVIMEEEEDTRTATIVDLESYELISDGDFMRDDDDFRLRTMDGKEITIPVDSVRIITSEQSMEDAEEVAAEYAGVEGQIIYYGKNASKVLKLTL